MSTCRCLVQFTAGMLLLILGVSTPGWATSLAARERQAVALLASHVMCLSFDPAVRGALRTLTPPLFVVKTLYLPPVCLPRDPQSEIPLLLAALQDDNRMVRVAAADLLMTEPQHLTRPLLLDIVQHPRIPQAMPEIVQVLGGMGSAAFDPVLRALDDADPAVRTASVRALGMIGDARAVEPLIDALHDPAGVVRVAAAEALCRLPDPRAEEPLRAALRGGNMQAARALAAIDATRFTTPVQ